MHALLVANAHTALGGLGCHCELRFHVSSDTVLREPPGGVSVLASHPLLFRHAYSMLVVQLEVHDKSHQPTEADQNLHEALVPNAIF